MEVKPLKQSSTKRTCKDSDSNGKKAKKDGNCECNSASEMCSKTKSPKKPTSSTRASRACASRDSKSSHKSTTTKSCS